MKTDTNLQVRKANDRGHADHGWLDTWHTFSFGDYYDPSHMGFRSLRVINDDIIAPGGGFPAHPHRDMEIFSYVLEGQLSHEDSLGNKRVLSPGEIQLMRAGAGIKHAEFNPSMSQRARLLQIWIIPATRGLEPAYTEWTRSNDESGKTLVISPDGRDGSATIAQDAFVYLVNPVSGTPVKHSITEGRGFWLHVAKGALTVNGIELSEGDAVFSEFSTELEIEPTSGGGEAILFDLK